MAKQEQLRVGVDPGALGRRGEPREADLDRAQFASPRPEPWAPIRRDPDRAARGQRDLRVRRHASGRRTSEVRVDVVVHLRRPRDPGERIRAAILLGGDSQIRGMAMRQRLETHQAAFEDGALQGRNHSRLDVDEPVSVSVREPSKGAGTRAFPRPSPTTPHPAGWPPRGGRGYMEAMPRLREVSRDEAAPFVGRIYQMLFGERDPVREPGTETGSPGNWWTVFALS